MRKVIRNPQATFYEVKDGDLNRVFMELAFEEVLKDSIQKVRIPAIALDEIRVENTFETSTTRGRVCIDDINFLRLPIIGDEKGRLAIIEIKKRMTLQEVEEELGHRIELV